MRPGSLSHEQEHFLQDLLGDIVEYETELLKFSHQSYSQVLQKEEYSHTSDTENHQNIVNECSDESGITSRLADCQNTKDVALPNHVNKDNKVSEDIDKKHEISDELCTSSTQTEYEVKISQFKTRLKSILTT